MDEIDGTFPASEKTPGQKVSRRVYRRLIEKPPAKAKLWWEDFQGLLVEGWTWRVAALIAWESAPANRRWPETQLELATQVLGLKNDRVIRKWREQNPEIEKRVARLVIEPLMRHRREVIDALVAVAKRHDPDAHQDRKLYLIMTKDYQPRGTMALTGADGGPIEHQAVSDLTELEDDDLDQVIANLQAAAGATGDGADGTGGTPGG